MRCEGRTFVREAATAEGATKPDLRPERRTLRLGGGVIAAMR